jgi:hypothetical protein
MRRTATAGLDANAKPLDLGHIPELRQSLIPADFGPP